MEGAAEGNTEGAAEGSNTEGAAEGDFVGDLDTEGAAEGNWRRETFSRQKKFFGQI